VDTAEDQLPPGGQPMDIIAKTNSMRAIRIHDLLSHFSRPDSRSHPFYGELGLQERFCAAFCLLVLLCEKQARQWQVRRLGDLDVSV
jgi:hypothetical protein